MSNLCNGKFTPYAIQFISLGASALCVVFAIFGFVHFNPTKLVINCYVLVFGFLAFIADINCFGWFGYIKFIYTRRGLLFVLLGCLMLEHSLFTLVSGFVMVGVGILYFVTASVHGGVPKPLLQRNVMDLPLTTELRFVDVPSNSSSFETNFTRPGVVGARAAGTPQGFRL